MLREVVGDTETTGLKAVSERIVEIGLVEIVNLIPTGREFHAYCRPEKPMPREAQKVHGLSDIFLRDKPLFREIVPDLLEFLGDSPFVAHNAKFDQGFIDAELARLDLPPLANPIIDTLALSQEVRKGKGSHKLDAICRDYGISLAKRTKHGALLDAQILAEAYVELRGGRQTTMSAICDVKADKGPSVIHSDTIDLYRDRAHISRITPLEAIDHDLFVRDQVPNAIWATYFSA